MPRNNRERGREAIPNRGWHEPDNAGGGSALKRRRRRGAVRFVSPGDDAQGTIRAV